jgi:hypothetical protein
MPPSGRRTVEAQQSWLLVQAEPLDSQHMGPKNGPASWQTAAVLFEQQPGAPP